MADTPDRYAFEQFPRGSLEFQFTRRQFWAMLVTGVKVYHRKSQGGAAFNLSELGNWPDEQLAQIKPSVVQGCVISTQDGLVWAKVPQAEYPVRLFSLDSPALAVFNRFNGQTPLNEVSRCLAQDTGWETRRSFAYVRGLFLTLVLSGICQPASERRR